MSLNGLNDKNNLIALAIIYSSLPMTGLIITPFLCKTLLSEFCNFSLDFLQLLFLRNRFLYFLSCLYQVCMRKAAFHFITEAIVPTKFWFLRVERFLQISYFGQTLDCIIYQLTLGFIVMMSLVRGARNANRSLGMIAGHA
jgi:hypothetical protein